MTTFRYILCDHSGAVGNITLNRPEVLNSFNKVMSIEVQEALHRFAVSPEVRTILITGAGRGFCAGQDLAEFTRNGPEEISLSEVVKEQFNPIVRLLRSTEKPVVCALNGVAAGAGANIALSCDFILASENASFSQSFSKVGLIPDSGGTFLLPRLVGLHQATRLMMLSDKMTAAEAMALGLLYKVVPEAALKEVARDFAAKLAAMPTRALGLTKRALNSSFGNTFEEQLNLEALLQEEAGATEDFLEGVQSFIQKRQPKFKGR